MKHDLRRSAAVACGAKWWPLAFLAAAIVPCAEAFRTLATEEAKDDPSFLQTEAKERTKVFPPLFIVNVAYDWKKYDPKDGVTVTMDNTKQALHMEAGINPVEGIAWGFLTDKMATTGWMELLVETTNAAQVKNDVKMYAAGFLEGLITATRISQFYSNFYQLMNADEMSRRAIGNIRNMFKDELEYVKVNSNFHGGATSLEPADPYWKHMRYIYLQMHGILDGYNVAALGKGVRTLDMVDMMMINSNGELPELMEAYKPDAAMKRYRFQKESGGRGMAQDSFIERFRSATRKARGGAEESPSSPTKVQVGDPRATLRGKASAASDASMGDVGASPRNNWTAHLSDHDWEKKLVETGHCSALIRLAPENKDLFIGHTTWNDYSKMTRIFKYYNFKLPGSWSQVSMMGFSSYPGCVSSTDDYYMLDSGLVVMDTSLEILNPTLYDRLPEFPGNSHVPNFMHVQVVNRMATSGARWASLFGERNSGTNNAQWMVVDYNRFKPERPIQDGLLWIIEQVPGIIHKADLSQHLASTAYWASYNRPYFEDVRRMSGHSAAQALYGGLYSYDGGPRATIFKHLAVTISDLFNMRSIMNRNAFPNEGILPNEPGHAISARMDLDKLFGHIPNGGIDAKVTNRCLFRSMQTQAISGPSHDSQPVFKWVSDGVEQFSGWPHMGMPDVWDFSWVQMTPTKEVSNIVDVNEC